MKVADAPVRALAKPKAVARRGERRRWSEWRQAYFPRRWPSLLVVPVLLLCGAPVLMVVLSVLAVDALRVIRWEHQHPLLTPLELLEVKRAWAPYN